MTFRQMTLLSFHPIRCQVRRRLLPLPSLLLLLLPLSLSPPVVLPAVLLFLLLCLLFHLDRELAVAALAVVTNR